jgi:hypothetical protein
MARSHPMPALLYFFLTHPGNRGRKDLCCLFGCRTTFKSMGSKIRAQEYRQTVKGKLTKCKLNKKRYLREFTKEDDIMGKKSKKSPKADDDIMEYMGFMASLTEEKPVTKADMKQGMKELEKKWSQHPLSYWEKYYKLPSGVVKNGDTS